MSEKGNSGMSLEDFKREALKLGADERRELADTLYESLEEEEGDSALPAEVRRRVQAYLEGKVKPLPAEEVFAKLLAEPD
jgi:putative addiction module component (TIGR02574 family)